MLRTDSLDHLLGDAVASGFHRIGQVVIAPHQGGYSLCHGEDVGREGLTHFSRPAEASAIARFDDAGAFRPLKSAPGLRHGWRLDVRGIPDLRLALDGFYPAALGNWRAWLRDGLRPVALRSTVNRQTGMYRIAGKITDVQAAGLVEAVCVPGCLRCRLWAIPEDVPAPHPGLPGKEIPLLCGEACSLLVAAARRIVKGIPLDQVE